ncbi:hypothetical protein EXIGLDRAFT_766983 [Exidia glandulosa HHB12029]|uniref:Uncharacterized protein n=1 Tax=Exidia glandulosa HHB12029 TaxID=1314781 RepID=A0A165JAF9_EXIGL|nr:hypothetical protein EXIGLDRAFT_766983 [Exidia glandulosa HHB12029]
MRHVYVEPVTRDDNTFRCTGLGDSDFTARAPGESQSYARADTGRLYSLLTYVAPVGPALTKKGTVRVHQPRKHQDEPLSFYRAQCLHYGLKPFATKPTAKKHLLAGLSGGKTLEVPANMVKMRQEMQAEWTAAQKVAEAKARELEEAETRAREEKKKQDAALFAAIIGPSSTVAAGSKKRKASSSAGAAATSKKSKAVKKLSSSDTAAQYRIVAPYLSSQWSFATRGEMWLKMSPSRRTGRHLWMSFDFGAVAGIMRGAAPPTQTNVACTFAWRGSSHAGEGELMHGKGNRGTITFLGDGKIRGTMSGSGLGDYEFVGERVDKPNVVWAMSVAAWKSSYRAINDRCYEAQGAARWGKWVSYDDCEERADASDSSANDLGSDPGSGDESEEESRTMRKTKTLPRKQIAMKKQPSASVKAQKLTWKDTEGQFTVSAPYLTEQWEEWASGDMWLKIAHSESERRVWISFDFGVVSGIMRGSAPPKESTTACTLTWHGYEQGEGEMTFTDENVGSITFLGGGKLRGTISGSFMGEDVEFTGQKVDRPNTVWSMSIPGWKAKYRRINFAAHDRASRARWGKWVAEVDDADPPEDSDSDAGTGGCGRRRDDYDEYDSHDEGRSFDGEEDYDDYAL